MRKIEAVEQMTPGSTRVPTAEDRFSQAQICSDEVAFGIRRYDNEQLHQLWMEDITPFLKGLGLAVPPPDYDRHL
jgi:1,2-phenylacetyl-CoA epoxidase catalytic subunit